MFTRSRIIHRLRQTASARRNKLSLLKRDAISSNRIIRVVMGVARQKT